MDWKRILRFLVNLGLAGFLIFTALLLFTYFGLLWQKIVEPHQKNMKGKEALILALPAIAFTIVDLFIIRRFIRLIRK